MNDKQSSLFDTDIYQSPSRSFADWEVDCEGDDGTDVLPQAENDSADDGPLNGHIEVKFIPKGKGKECGPYYYLRYREGGRLKSKYLGKDPQAFKTAKAALTRVGSDSM